MAFGYSTNAFVHTSLVQAVESIAALGFSGVEIMGDKPHLYPPEYSDEKIVDLRDKIRSSGLKITNINCFTLFAVGDTYLPSWIEPDERRREIRIRHTINTIHVAALLGCENISIPPGGPVEQTPEKEAVKLFHKGMERVIPKAEEQHVKLLIEPEPGLLLENSRQFLSFIKDVRSSMVGLNFDIGHFFCVNESPAEAFEMLFEWVGHIHIEDIDETGNHHHLIPGRGAIGYDDFFLTAQKMGYTGDITLELYTCADNPVAAGKESFNYLKPYFERYGLDTD